MRTIVIGDIHGCYNELKEMLLTLEEEGAYNKETDKIVFLGDYIDRGENSRLVIKTIRELQAKNKNVIALMGNHEDMLLDYLNDERNDDWVFNGYRETLKSYDGHKEEFESDIRWMKKLPLYHEDENFIFVHAGINMDKSMEEQGKHTLLWVREQFIYDSQNYNKTVVFGHTPTISINGQYKPIYTVGGNICVDTGCVYGGALSALIIEDNKVDGFYQVEYNYNNEGYTEEYEEENI